MEVYQRGEGREVMGEKVQAIRSIYDRYKIYKNSIRNRKTKELIRTTHGHELRWWGMLVGEVVQGRGE